MFRTRDAIEITANRLKTVICRNRAVAEILDLLQDGLGCARGKHIARNEQHRQVVDVSKGGGRDHVGCPRPDRGCYRHGALAIACLGIGYGGMGHALLVMTTPHREIIPSPVQCFAKPGDIAMTENRPQ